MIRFNPLYRGAFILATFAIFLLAFHQPAWAGHITHHRRAAKADPVVKIVTSQGTIVVKLFVDKAPKTVANFLEYTHDHFYDGTIFHRVIDGFMIQGGGFTPGMHQKATRGSVVNEADNGLLNKRGTIAMARTMNVDSATAQFFINLVDNPALDFREKSMEGFGYCVFGEVVKGMDVVDRIAKVSTTSVGPSENVPANDVVIRSIRKER